MAFLLTALMVPISNANNTRGFALQQKQQLAEDKPTITIAQAQPKFVPVKGTIRAEGG